MRALIIASMAVSLLFTGSTTSSAEPGKRLKSFLEALVDMQTTAEETVKTKQPKGQAQPTKPKPQ